MAIQTDHKDIINLIMGDLTQFHIPIYQRSYTWEGEKQVAKLIDDIVEFGNEYKDNSRAEYYIGNIIVKNQTRGLITERVVIDGQQRITTAILILCAIRDYYLHEGLDGISDDEYKSANSIHNSLYIKDGDDIKLKLNNMEHQQTLTKLLSNSQESITIFDKQTKYWKNYNYISNRLTRMGKNNFNNFLALLGRVKVVIIFLDEDQDENSVFESINSLGKPLAGSDLIKNYIFTFKNYECSHDDEKSLTELYTKTFESLFKEEKDIEKEIESFFRTYIAISTHTLVKTDPKIIYYSFKKLIGEIESVDKCKEIILDLTKWALIHQTIKVRGHTGIDKNLLGYLRTSFGIYVTLLMSIVEKYSHIEGNELIVDDRDEINKAFKEIVAYDAARFMANYPTGELARFIPTVSKKLSLSEFSIYNSYADKFNNLVTMTTEGYQRPSIEIMKHDVASNNLYTRKRQKTKKLLILLENIGKKELLNYEDDLKKAQIEHIIPQTLIPNDWSNLSHEEHQRYLHTLGNLTLTFDNQKLSNKPFRQKKTILAEKSRIIMNMELLKYETFGVNELEDRALSLLDRFLLEYFDLNEDQQQVMDLYTDTDTPNTDGDVSEESVYTQNSSNLKDNETESHEMEMEQWRITNRISQLLQGKDNEPEIEKQLVENMPYTDVDPQKRYEMIEKMAYHRGKSRNFETGHEHEDWEACEKKVDELIEHYSILENIPDIELLVVPPDENILQQIDKLIVTSKGLSESISNPKRVASKIVLEINDGNNTLKNLTDIFENGGLAPRSDVATDGRLGTEKYIRDYLSWMLKHGWITSNNSNHIS